MVLSKQDDSAQEFSLPQNYPNPINKSATTFPFTITQTCDVSLKVYTVKGEELANLLSKKLTPGKYHVEWKEIPLASGVYFYKLEAGDLEVTRKFIIIN